MAQKMCLQCGSIGNTERFMKGSVLTELFLWLFFLLPGLIYSIWRHSTVAQVCAKCKSPNVIPLDSPVARNILANQPKGPTSVTPAAPTVQDNRMSPRTALVVVGAFSVLVIVILASLGGTKGQPSSVPDSAPTRSYVLPAEFSIQPAIERGPEGELYVLGTANFPDGMKMSVALGPKKAVRDAFVNGGKFRSGPLYQDAPAVSGRQPLEIIAYFNGAWQNQSVLSILGDGGKNLHGALFKSTDPDVVDSDKILDARFTLSVPPLTPEANAIMIVKKAILTVPDKGKSAADIEDNIKEFESPGTGVARGKGWSAAPSGAGQYNIKYDFIDGSAGEKQAIWSVNLATKQVSYVNEAAKLFSWTPDY